MGQSQREDGEKMRPHFWHRVLGTKPDCFGDYCEKKHKCGTFSESECYLIDECIYLKWKKGQE